MFSFASVTAEGETLRKDVLFLTRSRSSKCETAPTFQKMVQDCLSQLQLLRPARRLPQGRCHFVEQLEQRTLWYRRHSRLCAHALANAGASAKCNES
jgi:hypothetical protein